MTEDTQEILNIGIGKKEPVTLKPSKVEVQGIRLDPKEKDGKKVGDLIVLICKHPDKDETIELSNAKVLSNEKVKLSALWFNKDEDGLLAKKSVAAQILRHYEVANFGDLVGKQIETTIQAENNTYLCIKAY